MIYKFFSVMFIGILELWAAIPAGFAFGLHPVIIGLASIMGSIIGVIFITGLGSGFRSWILKRRQKKNHKKGKIYDIWDKYGVIGLGLLSPVLTGALFGAAIGITLGAKKGPLILWMSIGSVIWTIVLVSLASLGITGFMQTIY